MIAFNHSSIMGNAMTEKKIKVIGAGLAGCEAAARLARAGHKVELYEMKPVRFSPAHSAPTFGELVCSNSFRSNDPHSAVGLLKEEMRRLDSIVMEAAEQTNVPAGKALAVDRDAFSRYLTSRLESLGNITVVRGEVEELDANQLTIIASGPLTSDALSQKLAELVGSEYLYFYDAVAPIVAADSINMEIAFEASRYDETGSGDYINCPFSEEEYNRFYEELMAGDKTQLRDFEKPHFFEGCLPIEVMAERGRQTLTFGPMKPVGLTDPRTGNRPFAVVQLRKENTQGTLYNIVGFQTRLKRPEQNRVFRFIPGLEEAEFARWGSVHRNTFLHSPTHLNRFLQLIKYPNLFVAGQLSGVEGYVESAAMGILAGENAARAASGKRLTTPPRETAMGALVNHLTDRTVRKFQPSNVNFGLTPPLETKIRKKERPLYYVERAKNALTHWLEAERIPHRGSI